MTLWDFLSEHYVAAFFLMFMFFAGLEAVINAVRGTR